MKNFFTFILISFLSFNSFSMSKDMFKENKTPIKVIENNKEVDVIEFFSYMCPHCYSFENTFNKFNSKFSNKNIIRIPVNFMPDYDNLQKIFFTIEELKLDKSIHSKVFNEIHQNKFKFNNSENILKFLNKEKIDSKLFMSTFSSFSIANKVQKANNLVKSMEIEGVPTLVYKGKYFFYGTENSIEDISNLLK